MRRSFGRCLVLLLTCVVSGCSAGGCYDCLDEMTTGCHDHLTAKLAWHRCKGCYCEVEYIGDFRGGFIDGYTHVMGGGGCCRPTLPPRKYWSSCTRGGDINCRIVAWYNGWDAGVVQAMRDGMGSGPVTTAADIFHTNTTYAVPLPEDLRRQTGDESGLAPVIPQMLPYEQEMLLEQAPYYPVNPETELPTADTPPAPSPPPYNPPVNPTSVIQRPYLPVDDRVYFTDSLMSPVPMRTDGLGN